MNSWKKEGVVYRNQGVHSKLLSHAANPLPVKLNENVTRIFFSSRDRSNRSSVGSVDYDVVKKAVIEGSEQFVFPYGESDSFYSHGVSIGNCFECGGRRLVLFMGWKNEVGEHWYGQIGALELHDDMSMTLVSEAPFLGLDDEDPISLSYPWVLKHDGLYRMWYGSTVSWDLGNAEMLHVIKYAESKDGLTWEKKGQVVESKMGHAQAFSRPSVIVDHSGVFHMWFSYRSGDGTAYRIGYCKSTDGKHWSFPKLDLDVSSSGWDDSMVEYPFVYKTAEQIHMLYNGNGYGTTGFGLAILSKESLYA